MTRRARHRLCVKHLGFLAKKRTEIRMGDQAAQPESRDASQPRYAWYGDDFTGAADTLATIAAAGWRACLFLQAPTAKQLACVGPLDALGVAGTSRALTPDGQRSEMQAVAALFKTLAPSLTHYKCCSTFDSAPTVGNLWVGLQCLRHEGHRGPVLVLGGQPSLGRYCAFGELYATAGQDGEVHRIDRHPTMSRHPVTPMHEADLRRHLTAQGLPTIGLVDLRVLHDADAAALEQTIQRHAADGLQAVLFDATSGEHLHTIGQAWWMRAKRHPLLVLGASSVAQALACAWPNAPGTAQATVTGQPPTPTALKAALTFVLAGSLSPITAAQVAQAGEGFERVELDVASMVASDAALNALAKRCAAGLAAGRSVLACTPPHRDESLGATDVAQACGRLLTRVLTQAPLVRRVGVAGGDTSSWALRALAPWALQWAGALAPGVPMLRAQADDQRVDGLELMLKGGQMGPPDLFARLLGVH